MNSFKIALSFLFLIQSQISFAAEERNFFNFSQNCRRELDSIETPTFGYAVCSTIKLPLYISDYLAIPFNLTTAGYKALTTKTKSPKEKNADQNREIPEEKKYELKNKYSLFMSLRDEALEFKLTKQAGPLFLGLIESIQSQDQILSVNHELIADEIINMYSTVLNYQENETRENEYEVNHSHE